jgi:hypothetical protein
MDKQQQHNQSHDDLLSAQSAYDGLDIDNSLWTEVDAAGSLVTVIGKDFENGLKRIHAFVDRVRRSDEPAYRMTTTPSGRVIAQRTKLGSIPASTMITPGFRQAYEVSEQVRVFLDAEEELQLQQEHPLNYPLRESLTQAGKLVGDVANEFVKLVRWKTRRKNFRRRLGVRRFGAQENFRRGKALIEALFRRYARINVVRIDLGYLRDHRPALEQAKEDMALFLNNSRRNSIFHSVVGTIWHLEWGVETGYHRHVMLFLDGSKTRQDGYVAQQMGEYWVGPITKGRGRFHNCNADKNLYKRLGIGMIGHDDEEKRDVLVNVVLRYLTKVDELVRPRVPKGTKTFATSHMPEPHPGAGRPRMMPQAPPFDLPETSAEMPATASRDACSQPHGGRYLQRAHDRNNARANTWAGANQNGHDLNGLRQQLAIPFQVL